MKLKELVKTIQNIHVTFSQQPKNSVNLALTFRNWLIGCYIKEYEQRGKDRSEYGANVLKSLANELQIAQVPSTEMSRLKQCRQFYEVYPDINQTVCRQFGKVKKIQDIHETPVVTPENLVNHLSFSHFVELIKIKDPLKRFFYEKETIQNNWGAKKLSRQITTLYYERLEFSKNKEKISEK